MSEHQLWWAWPFWFQIYYYFQIGQISIWTMVLNQLELAQNFLQVGVAVKCMHTNFDGCGFLVSEILLLSKMTKFLVLFQYLIVE